MGFCYGGPYAILGPKRLGYAAGIACHGSNMREFLAELDRVDHPVCVIWGDNDGRASSDVLDAYREVSSRKRNVEVHVLEGVRHGYMLRTSRGFDAIALDFSMARAFAILDALRTDDEAILSPRTIGRPVYEVQRRARHAERPGFRISELQISPSQSVPWHFHSRTRDVLYVIEGTLLVHLLEPPEDIPLEPGDALPIRPRRPHHVTNGGDQPATFLVLQGIGEVDFVPLDNSSA